MIANPVDKDEAAAELAPLRNIFTKSIVAGADLCAGTILSSEHLKLKKPGTGLSAAHLPELIGKPLRRNLNANDICRAPATMLLV